MLYEEFIKGTNVRETKDTYSQYETLEKIYMNCEAVTKEDIYRIWKQTYGKQQKLDQERLIKEIEEMSSYYDEGDTFTPEQHKIRRRLLQTVISVAETNEFCAGWTGEITNPEDVTYLLKDYNKINGHRQARLWIRYDGKLYGTNAIYSFGDARIHATPERLNEVAK